MQIHLACVCVFVCVRGVRAGVRACGRAGVRACGRAGVRACGRACACVFGCVGVVVHFCEGECGGFLRGPQSVSDVSHHGGGSRRDRSHSPYACLYRRERARAQHVASAGWQCCDCRLSLCLSWRSISAAASISRFVPVWNGRRAWPLPPPHHPCLCVGTC